MSQVIRLKAKGLYTSWSEFADIPEGALIQADNVDISSDNILEPRRGFEREEAGYSNSDDRTDQIWEYQGKIFAHHGETLGSADDISYLNSGSWTSIGAFTAPAGFKIRTLEASENLYFTTASGVQKLDVFSGTPRFSGAFKGLDIQASLSASSGSILSNAKRVAYRVLWGIEDANGNLQLGAPSQRADLSNTSGSTKDVDLVISIPDGVTTSWLFQVYRSAQFGTSAEPNDELQLVYEANPTSGQITAGTISVTDNVPDSLRGATIYTAASQETIAFANERPPLAKDLASFRDVTFYANTVSKHRYYLTMVAVDSPNGVQNNDTISIGGVTYTGSTSAENIATATFLVSTGGSAAQNIIDTSLSLVKVINRHSSSTVYAYYLSGVNDLPGKILLEERSIGGSAFVLTASRATSWNPTDIPSSGTTETSSNDAFVNGLSWSKPFQPEAVPLVNQVQIGSKSAAILRIVPLKDALIVFKEDGIYRLTGFYPSFDVELLDSSARLIGSETPQILNNQIYCLTDQGVTVVADSVKIISRPIEQTLLALFAADLDLVKTQSFSVSYEPERKYLLWLPTTSSDTTATQAFVYNVFTQSWVRYTLSASAGFATTTQLYYASPGTEYIFKDRRSFTYTDFADFKETNSITAISGNVLTLNDASGVSVGDIIFESSTVFAFVNAVNTLDSQVTVATNPGFTVTSVDILSAIDTVIRWAPIAADNPGISKQFHTTQVVFKSDFSGAAFMTYETDLNPSRTEVELSGSEIGGWGLFTWGSVPWGGDPRKRPVSQWVPRDKQRCSQLTVGFKHSYAFSSWKIQGLSVHFTPGSDNTSRG